MPESWAAKNVSLIEAGLIAGEWFEYARDTQYPLGPTLDNWPDTWLVMGGRVDAATFLTEDEKREAVGYRPRGLS